MYLPEVVMVRIIGNINVLMVTIVRTARVSLDPSQYHFDMTNKDEDVYGSFNLLIRRKPKENNFKV
jgi:hypothetical protein